MSKDKESVFKKIIRLYKSIFILTFRLFIICAISALLLAATYLITKPEIDKRSAEEGNESRQAVLTQADKFEEISIDLTKYPEVQGVYIGRSNDRIEGYVIEISTTGYNSGLNVVVGILNSGAVENVYISSMDETPGLGTKAAEEPFIGQFKGKNQTLTLVKSAVKADNEVEAISGATMTSNGVTNAVNTAIEIYNSNIKES